MASQHLLQSLPREPDEQLRLGLQVVELAYGEKARQLEAELHSLRAYGKERQTQVALLERRVGELEAQLSQSEQRTRELASENAGLINEKTALFNEVRQLQERLGKLDQFKRAIMQSISENDQPLGGTRPSFGGLQSEYNAGSIALGYGITGAVGGGCSSSAYGAGAVPPRAYTPLHSPPAVNLGTREPVAKSAQSMAGSSIPTPAMSPPPIPGAAPAPAAEGNSAALDGKDFFRAARLRLSYARFFRHSARRSRVLEQGLSLIHI